MSEFDPTTFLLGMLLGITGVVALLVIVLARTKPKDEDK